MNARRNYYMSSTNYASQNHFDKNLTTTLDGGTNPRPDSHGRLFKSKFLTFT